MTDAEIREMQERAVLVEGLADNPGWLMLLDRARATLLNKQTRIIQGKCKDYEDYVRECAFIEGCDFIFKLPDRIRTEVELHLAELELQREQDEDEYAAV